MAGHEGPEFSPSIYHCKHNCIILNNIIICIIVLIIDAKQHLAVSRHATHHHK